MVRHSGDPVIAGLRCRTSSGEMTNWTSYWCRKDCVTMVIQAFVEFKEVQVSDFDVSWGWGVSRAIRIFQNTLVLNNNIYEGILTTSARLQANYSTHLVITYKWNPIGITLELYGQYLATN